MLLREQDPHAGAAFLRGRAGSDQPPARLVGALFGLSWQGATDIEHRPLLLGQLGHPDELVVQEAIDGLASLGSSQDVDVVASHATHSVALCSRRGPALPPAGLRRGGAPLAAHGAQRRRPSGPILGPGRTRRPRPASDDELIGQMTSRHRRTCPTDRRLTSRVLIGLARIQRSQGSESGRRHRRAAPGGGVHDHCGPGPLGAQVQGTFSRTIERVGDELLDGDRLSDLFEISVHEVAGARAIDT